MRSSFDDARAAHGIAPCAFWPTTPREQIPAIGNDVPVLLVQARGDVNTIHAGGVELHRRLTASRLVSVDIRAHGVYGRAADGYRPSRCAERIVNRYFLAGKLPLRDVSCSR